MENIIFRKIKTKQEITSEMRLEMARAFFDGMKKEKFLYMATPTISAGNRKMGEIPSFSVMPIITCPAGAPCFNECYARAMCNRFGNVENSYLTNTALFFLFPEKLEKMLSYEVRKTAKNGLFRWHVAGDIINGAYFKMMIRIANALPRISFLAFTKKHALVNRVISDIGAENMPENLHIVFSDWPGVSFENPYNLPVCRVVFPDQKPDAGAHICPGNCANCNCSGGGCFNSKPGDIINIALHGAGIKKRDLSAEV